MQAPYASASHSRSGRGKRRMSLRSLHMRLAVLDAENTDLVVATPHDLDSKHLRSRWNLQDELIRYAAEAGKLKQRTALGPVPHLTIEDAAVGENDLAGLQDFSKPRFRTPIGPRSFGRRGPSRVVGFRLAGFVRSGTSLCAASEDAREIMQIEVVCGERPADGPGRTGDFTVLIARQQWEQLHEFTSRFRRKHCGSLPFFCLSPLLMAPGFGGVNGSNRPVLRVDGVFKFLVIFTIRYRVGAHATARAGAAGSSSCTASSPSASSHRAVASTRER